jgi:hypothetical protein
MGADLYLVKWTHARYLLSTEDDFIRDHFNQSSTDNSYYISEEELDETIAELSKEELEQFKELIEVLKEKLKENDGAMDVAIAY